MIQIKILSSNFSDDLQKEVNAFLREKEKENERSMLKFSYVDLKYSQTDPGEGMSIFTCVIIYKMS